MDINHALRRLARSPGFLVASCVSLALAIGANTAAFSLVHATLLRSLPVHDAASLALVSAGSATFSYSMLVLVLASVGLFSVMANAVSRRTKELGVRLAIGATPSLLIRSVFSEAAVLVACGVLLSLPAVWLMARTVRGLLFGIPIDGWQGLAVPVAMLTVVAASAAWVPARRASRVDPLNALRSE